ncbi:phosphoenolpyruvate--protein phosphotransferase [Cellulomonas humilata]|uniref:Phosphoenolpyruvate-protein phosphotransferase n=1 Tax=Cellulomonas humilata TaxID=144055 RepID=A0A7Y6A3R6_9CELL|nr:phosphoenolpyruvate--protein phosphotransferase [Cellulomonas humilata]NUU18137.1 phosphoenolpyruvate--protein phosphotransferase [Cellulomonas humilata]
MSVAAGRRTLAGVGVGRGLVVGPIAKAYPSPVIPPQGGGDPAQLGPAFDQVATSLQARAQAATGALAAVLGATAQMAADPALRAEAEQRVAAGETPAEAVDRAIARFVDMFTAAGGALAERVTDLRSVRDRVVAVLLDLDEPGVPPLTEPSIVVAADLAPADTAALDVRQVLAIVTERGGPTGHTAIIAGQLGIPCVVRTTGIMDLEPGTEVAVDAVTGTVTLDPGPEIREQSRARRAAAVALESDTAPGATADGHAVKLMANIGTGKDADRAGAVPTEGVGLFRTEVLYLGRATAPSQAEQVAEYSRVLRAFAGGKVVVRTLDAGADKPLPFVTQAGEENPALGVRGYRLVRSHPELLDTQLEALARAQAETGTTPWVMAPMVTTPAEARDFAARARAAGVSIVGVMIEVPAAALRAREILAEVDFVSVGTNDLAQYTMASDRLRGELADLLDPWQPAVLDLVDSTARAGLRARKPVGVCGESASDPVLALVLVGLGVTSLSMSVGAIPAVRYALRHHTSAECATMAATALAAQSAGEGRAAVVALLHPDVRETLGV